MRSLPCCTRRFFDTLCYASKRIGNTGRELWMPIINAEQSKQNTRADASGRARLTGRRESLIALIVFRENTVSMATEKASMDIFVQCISMEINFDDVLGRGTMIPTAGGDILVSVVDRRHRLDTVTCASREVLFSLPIYCERVKARTFFVSKRSHHFVLYPAAECQKNCRNLAEVIYYDNTLQHDCWVWVLLAYGYLLPVVFQTTVSALAFTRRRLLAKGHRKWL